VHIILVIFFEQRIWLQLVALESTEVNPKIFINLLSSCGFDMTVSGSRLFN
jgi:hypothetical protein